MAEMIQDFENNIQNLPQILGLCSFPYCSAPFPEYDSGYGQQSHRPLSKSRGMATGTESALVSKYASVNSPQACGWPPP